MAINKAIILGNLGKDPEVRTLDNGMKVATITVATTEKGYTTQSGQQIPEKTYWHNIVLWKQLAEVVEKYVSKGDKIYVEGKITSRSYDKNGTTVWVTEIVAEKVELLGGRKEEAPAQRQPAQAQYTRANESDNLPF